MIVAGRCATAVVVATIRSTTTRWARPAAPASGTSASSTRLGVSIEAMAAASIAARSGVPGPRAAWPPGGSSSGGGSGFAGGAKGLLGAEPGARLTPPGPCCGVVGTGPIDGPTPGRPSSRRPRGRRWTCSRIFSSAAASAAPSSNGPSASDSTRGLPPRKVMFDSVPTQIGSRSLSVTSGVRTMWGVRVSMTSVRLMSVVVRPNRRPMIGMSERPGMPDSPTVSSVRIRPARKFVSPSFSRIVDSIVRVPMIGWRWPLPASA